MRGLLRLTGLGAYCRRKSLFRRCIFSLRPTPFFVILSAKVRSDRRFSKNTFQPIGGAATPACSSFVENLPFSTESTRNFAVSLRWGFPAALFRSSPLFRSSKCQRELRFSLSAGRRSAHFRMASRVGQRDWPHGDPLRGRGRRATAALCRSMTRYVSLPYRPPARRIYSARHPAASARCNPWVVDSACEEVADHCPNLLWVSSAKWPGSKKRIIAPGVSRLNASAPRFGSKDKAEKSVSAPISSLVFPLRRVWSKSPSFHTTSHIAVAPFL